MKKEIIDKVVSQVVGDKVEPTVIDMKKRVQTIKQIISEFQRLWLEHPELRFCQLVSNLHGLGPQDIFYTSDQDFLTVVKEQLIESEHYNATKEL